MYQFPISNVLSFIRARNQPAWLVGGYVRDWLLGRPSHDLDVIVPEGGISLARAVAAAFGGHFFVLDAARDVGRAILYDEVGASLDVDVARLRTPDLLDDLALRDFTINAIALDIGGDPDVQRVVDPFDGQVDLMRGLVRAVTEGAFLDDPLRMLRGVRHVAALGFRIENATVNLIRRDAALLPTVAAERVRDELLRIIPAPGGWQHVRLLARLDLLRHVLPETAALIGVTQSPPHYQDVFDHTRAVMAHLEGIYALLWPGYGGGDASYARPQPVANDATVMADDAAWVELAEGLAPYIADLREHLAQPLASGHTRRDWLPWAALAHDWGKPAMRSVEAGGRIRFLEHDHWGTLLAEARGRALKLAADESAYVIRLVDQHMRPGHLAHDYPPSRRALYRFFRDADTAGPDCALLSLADHLATYAAQPDPERWGHRLGTTRLILETYFRERSARVDPAPLLNGWDVMAAFGLSPGPRIGELLEGLREAQAVGEVTTRDQALAWLALQIGDGS
ncbi:MAG: hypothetical protein CVU38_13415 [Chloroflexi bacterium HGW-Chloroflexi-1]|nr:MAG: hypothetical protein CVU38_13415 [Chloroflexi bacterium HGW-Chloroflexi-1]